MVAANSPMLTVPDQSASGGGSDIKANKFSRKSIGASPTKQGSADGHVPNGKNFSNRTISYYLGDCSIRVYNSRTCNKFLMICIKNLVSSTPVVLWLCC